MTQKGNKQTYTRRLEMSAFSLAVIRCEIVRGCYILVADLAVIQIFLEVSPLRALSGPFN